MQQYSFIEEQYVKQMQKVGETLNVIKEIKLKKKDKEKLMKVLMQE